MKRLRLEKWSGQVLSPRPGVGAGAGTPTSASSRSICAQRGIRGYDHLSSPSLTRHQSTDAFARQVEAEAPPSSAEQTQSSSTSTTSSATGPFRWPSIKDSSHIGPEPSPYHTRALHSAKLAALHARLALSDKIPLQTLARSLVDPSADPAPLFNNSNLAFLGQTLISYHASEMLMCKYPRLPMEIMYAAMKAFTGDRTLSQVSRSWGVENAAAPGAEVDPGLLQFDLEKPRSLNTKWGLAHPAGDKQFKYRRGISSRVITADDFGEQPHNVKEGVNIYELSEQQARQEAKMGLSTETQLSLGDPNEKLAKAHNIHAQFVRAVVGAIYTHSGREPARSFIKAHILSRQLDLERLFTFKLPTRELARLCAREEFEPPVARLLSETGRLSRTPVFVVGIFSGNDKLGEGAASSLDDARKKASMNALKAWYLYSPGEHVRVPSDMLEAGAKPWEPVYVDIGEVITPGVH
ncbi:54S ribosomal protein L3 mitochondrial [Gnomoniopsis smithogilvyi]|uniref:Large ribosomal subunit protein mL44 n=1 Tax=Gnomoniopsis smithogilvyi TaxID=1191159 RepID=A0A9W9CT92_9PEZI|nr:54S ribosomal protein L3 mitochondrial [Gnomoniopsis smithogilvyi]